MEFQFTLPRGERLAGIAETGTTESFNSRSRVGSDLGFGLTVDSSEFQFTLPRGERLNFSKIKSAIWVSIHAPAWGATGRA